MYGREGYDVCQYIGALLIYRHGWQACPREI